MKIKPFHYPIPQSKTAIATNDGELYYVTHDEQGRSLVLVSFETSNSNNGAWFDTHKQDSNVEWKEIIDKTREVISLEDLDYLVTPSAPSLTLAVGSVIILPDHSVYWIIDIGAYVIHGIKGIHVGEMVGYSYHRNIDELVQDFEERTSLRLSECLAFKSCDVQVVKKDGK